MNGQLRYSLDGPEVAYTIDEYNVLAASITLPREPRRASQIPVPVVDEKLYVDLNNDDLAVTFNKEGLFVAFRFRSATALMRMNDAHHLGSMLVSRVEDWRHDVQLPARRAQATEDHRSGHTSPGCSPARTDKTSPV